MKKIWLFIVFCITVKLLKTAVSNSIGATVAQQVERVLGKHEVPGSNPGRGFSISGSILAMIFRLPSSNAGFSDYFNQN